MILRLAGPQRYQLTAADALGRALWAADYQRGEFLFIDFRRRLACRSRKGFPVPEVALQSLPVAELPAVLLGRLPGRLVATSDRGTSDDFTDFEGHRWTVEGARDGTVASWTLWLEGRPVLWFRQLEEESVLSHRQGSQFRWRQTVAEPMNAVLEPVSSPAGVRFVECELLSESR